jgi:hypothetical protein
MTAFVEKRKPVWKDNWVNQYNIIIHHSPIWSYSINFSASSTAALIKP